MASESPENRKFFEWRVGQRIGSGVKFVISCFNTIDSHNKILGTKVGDQS